MSYKETEYRPRLASGQMIQACAPQRKNPKIKNIAIFGPGGGYLAALKFTEEDLPIVIATLQEALVTVADNT